MDLAYTLKRTVLRSKPRMSPDCAVVQYIEMNIEQQMTGRKSESDMIGYDRIA